VTRIAITISLDPATWQVIDDHAKANSLNTSAAIRALIAGDAPAKAPAAGHTVGISDAGHQVLEQLATSKGRTIDDVVKLALRYATQHSAKWL
jgi:hypothetical protein